MVAEPMYQIKAITQVCIVVRDLQKTMAKYWTTFGIGPWKIFTLSSPPVKQQTYLGRPNPGYRRRIAVAQVGAVQIELVQPLAGDSIMKDFLEQHGEGLHHLGVPVANIHEAMRQVEAAGVVAAQTAIGVGKSGDGGTAYLGTQEEFGAVIELIEPASEAAAPEAVYPPPA